MPDDLSAARRFYAEEIRAVANIESPRLIEAFAAVPREHYLGPGPWHIMVRRPLSNRTQPEYRLTTDSDPRHIYHNVLVGQDTTRGLNNGEPSSLARWLDMLNLSEGASALHIGCGVGYYTAIMEYAAGRTGRVVAVEVDEQLAQRAKTNLRHLENVEVFHSDGTELKGGRFDAIFVNAGATHPLLLWLDALNTGGRLIVPLTADSDIPNVGSGLMLLVENVEQGHRAQFISPVMVFHCAGARNPELNIKLEALFSGGDWKSVRSLRREPHDADQSCKLHEDTFCLSSDLV